MRASACVATLGSRIYLFGGARLGASVTDASAYDVATDTWEELPPLHLADDWWRCRSEFLRQTEEFNKRPPPFMPFELYRRVGGNYQWVDRLSWSDERWAAYAARVETHLVELDGRRLQREVRLGGGARAHLDDARVECSVAGRKVPANCANDVKIRHGKRLRFHLRLDAFGEAPLECSLRATGPSVAQPTSVTARRVRVPHGTTD